MYNRRGTSRPRKHTGAAKPARPHAPGATITALAPHPRDPMLVVVKSGRRTIGTIRGTDVQSLRIDLGAPVTESLLAALDSAERAAEARKYAINAVSHRAMSTRTLIGKLKRRDVDASTASSIADDLTAKGILDDAAYAETVARGELARKPAAKSFLIAKLRSRGVDDKTARAAADHAVSDPTYNAREQALTLARKKARSLTRLADPLAAKRRLYAQLARRGFDPETCAWATKQALAKS